MSNATGGANKRVTGILLKVQQMGLKAAGIVFHFQYALVTNASIACHTTVTPLQSCVAIPASHFLHWVDVHVH